MARKVFYSFHFDNDVMRVQTIRNIGAIEGNQSVTAQKWEEVKRQGDAAVEKWIDENMKDKSCVVVLVGEETANRKWVIEEIIRGWNAGKGVFGIYIHNIKCARNGTCRKGLNPFDKVSLKGGRKLSEFVPCYDPNPLYAYAEIVDKIDSWIASAVGARR